jgi:CheY-like chemotaxis protein
MSKIFAFYGGVYQSQWMAEPLALFLYEKLLPGGQLVNRLQDCGYRVQTLNDSQSLVEQAERDKPLLVLVDLEPNAAPTVDAISKLRQNTATSHIPVIAIASATNTSLQETARTAGATLVVTDHAILLHLNEFLEQALHID